MKARLVSTLMISLLALYGCTDDSGAAGMGGDGGTAGSGGMAGSGGAAGSDGECQANEECASSEYCEGVGCSGVGECVERPTNCDDSVALVCGCDGQTYTNACEAARAGARVRSEGECPCFSNNDCEPDEFCDAPYSCLDPGECVPRPSACTADIAPVCGCDDTTYDNSCLAATSGIRVSAIGTCDCIDNRDCDEADYCNANTCDGPGVCEVRPNIDDCPAEVDRVIACDGNAFENPCRAAAAGSRIRRE